MTDERGTNDLERRIEGLTKQKEYLQQQCRKAGKAILTLEAEKIAVSYTHLRAHETDSYLVCRLLL